MGGWVGVWVWGVGKSAAAEGIYARTRTHAHMHARTHARAHTPARTHTCMYGVDGCMHVYAWMASIVGSDGGQGAVRAKGEAGAMEARSEELFGGKDGVLDLGCTRRGTGAK